MKYGLVGLILVLLLQGSAIVTSQNNLMPVQCQSFDATIGSAAFIQFLGQLQGVDAWLGYPPPGEEKRVGVENIPWGTQYGFLRDTKPWNKREILYREAMSGDTLGAVQVMVDPDHPQDIYVFVYKDVATKTDANGEHPGQHPSCSGIDGSGSFIISQDDGYILLALSRETPLDVWPARVRR